jgi:hypothetical protein
MYAFDQLTINTKIDTNLYKSIEIYSYNLGQEGQILDSILVGSKNLSLSSVNHRKGIKDSVVFDSVQQIQKTFRTIKNIYQNILVQEKKFNAANKLLVCDNFAVSNEQDLQDKIVYSYDSLARIQTIKKYNSYALNNSLHEVKIANFTYTDSDTYQVFDQHIDLYQRAVTYSSWICFEKGKIVLYNHSKTTPYIPPSPQRKKLFEDANRIANAVQKQEHEFSDFWTKYSYNANNLPTEKYTFNVNTNTPISIIRYFYSSTKIKPLTSIAKKR